MAKSISVPVADSDTMRFGVVVAAVVVLAASPPSSSPQAAPPSRMATASDRPRARLIRDIDVLLSVGVRAVVTAAGRTNCPSSEDRFVAVVAGDLARPRRGITVAGQHRDLTGLRWPPRHPALPPGCRHLSPAHFSRLFCTRPG